MFKEGGEVLEKSANNQTGNVSARILAMAKALFVEQGYKKTTIRQIVEKSGILTGSIYHFYKNKEAIFREIVLLVVKQNTVLINKYFADESPAFKYAAMNVISIKAADVNEFIRESYYEGYTSNAIFEHIVEHVTDTTETMFKERQLHYSRQDYYVRNLLIRGALRSCAAKLYFKNDEVSSKKCSDMLVEMSLSLFEYSKDEIRTVLKRLEQLDGRLTSIAHQLIRDSVKL